ncbi:MAG: hypothetical protein IEMM0002_0499 [bacterium]|nr:MAG: hypothetical protein IEMM0002_0499 [bacterium]
MLTGYKFILPAIVVSLLVGGCGSNMLEFLGDKSSSQAKRESVQNLIDNEQYAEAVDVMLGQCGTDASNLSCSSAEDAQMLAAAYMGLSGLSVLDFIKNAEDTASGTGFGSDFQAIAFLFPSGSLNLTDLENIDRAVQVLCGIGGSTTCGSTNISLLNSDQSLQLTIAQATAGVMAMGVNPADTTTGGYNTTSGTPIFCDSNNNNSVAGCDGFDTLAIMLSTAVPATNAFGALNVGLYVTATLGSTVLSVNNIEQFVDAEVAQMINDLLATIDSGNCDVAAATNQVQITDTTDLDGGGLDTNELETYLQNCLQ